MTPSLEKLVNSFASLPGIGRKSAARLAYRIIEMSEDEVKSFADSILQAKSTVKLCDICQSYSENGTCSICSNHSRSRDTIIVVEDNKALEAIEETHEFNGMYHVLHGVISPVDGIGPENLKIKELLARLNESVKEIIIATNPSVEGEATAMYIARLIKPFGVTVTRLAYGLPVGSALEYTDAVTLLKAIEGRTQV
ncbi:MAG: recombination protein RecR [Clostridia bacterium]|nr:recombination protein RecR [Clostridia bacterium]